MSFLYRSVPATIPEDVGFRSRIAFLVARSIHFDKAGPFRQGARIDAVLECQIGKQLLARAMVSDQQHRKALRRIGNSALQLFDAHAQAQVMPYRLLEILLFKSAAPRKKLFHGGILHACNPALEEPFHSSVMEEELGTSFYLDHVSFSHQLIEILACEVAADMAFRSYAHRSERRERTRRKLACHAVEITKQICLRVR